MSAIRFDIADHVATILIDKSAWCNALDREDITNLRGAIDRAVYANSGVHAVVIGAVGKVFCSGLNLRRLVPTASGMAEQEGEIKRTHFNGLIMRLADLRVPTIAAVEGPAVGAGMSLAVACTMAVAARGAFSSRASRVSAWSPTAG
jgi:enoyl-CoA hydratase/carnithine racemase